MSKKHIFLDITKDERHEADVTSLHTFGDGKQTRYAVGCKTDDDRELLNFVTQRRFEIAKKVTGLEPIKEV